MVLRAVWTLWILLLGLPFAVLITGCVTLPGEWNRDIELPTTAHRARNVRHTPGDGHCRRDHVGSHSHPSDCRPACACELTTVLAPIDCNVSHPKKLRIGSQLARAGTKFMFVTTLCSGYARWTGSSSTSATTECTQNHPSVHPTCSVPNSARTVRRKT